MSPNVPDLSVFGVRDFGTGVSVPDLDRRMVFAEVQENSELQRRPANLNDPELMTEFLINSDLLTIASLGIGRINWEGIETDLPIKRASSTEKHWGFLEKWGEFQSRNELVVDIRKSLRREFIQGVPREKRDAPKAVGLNKNDSFFLREESHVDHFPKELRAIGNRLDLACLRRQAVESEASCVKKDHESSRYSFMGRVLLIGDSPVDSGPRFSCFGTSFLVFPSRSAKESIEMFGETRRVQKTENLHRHPFEELNVQKELCRNHLVHHLIKEVINTY